ncbi:MAG: class I SAM-dependent methyltransferase [Candidatus Sulfotelmatobacter sp.]
MMPKSIWDEWFGRRATRRLQRKILPHLRWNQEIWGEIVKRHLTHPVRWLDAGCGWRLLDKDLDPLEDELVRMGGKVVGVDLDFPHLRKHVNISRRTCASLAALPFPDASFDLITCNMVAEHLSEPAAIFHEISRVLADRGTFLLHTPNTRNYLVFANILAKKVLPRSLVLRLVDDGREEEDIYPTYYRANNESALRRLGDSVKLQPHFARFLTQPYPYSRFFAPAAFFELLFMRTMMTRPLNRFAATIVMSFRKGSSDSSSPACAASASKEMANESAFV